MTICGRVLEILNSKKMARKDLANAIGVPVTTLQTWLQRGEDFPARYVVPVADHLGVSTARLLYGTESEPPVIPEDYIQLNDDERMLIKMVRSLDREGVFVVTSRAIEESRRVRNSAQGKTPVESVG